MGKNLISLCLSLCIHNKENNALIGFLERANAVIFVEGLASCLVHNVLSLSGLV